MHWSKHRIILNLILITTLSMGIALSAQDYRTPAPSRGPQASAALTARLVDAEAKAKQKAATVEVTVSGIELIDPAKVNEKPQSGQGHLHYQVDKGPVIATTTTKLSFHGLTPGSHSITVMLAANDHSPLGPQQALTVTVPAMSAAPRD